MNTYEDLKEIHRRAKNKVESGRPHYDRIAGTILIAGGNRNYHIERPHNMDAYQFVFHTNMDDYNDPLPAIRDINTLIAKLEQLKISFIEAWKREMTKVTLEEEIAELERPRPNAFAKLAIPLFATMWNNNVRGPHNKLRAFGVTYQDYAELEEAARQDELVIERGMFNKLMFKGIPIVQDDRATYRNAVPIYGYGQPNVAKMDFKPDLIGFNDELLELEYVNCRKAGHTKECRCHEGWPIKRKSTKYR